MRLIGGEWGGRNIRTGEGPGYRPAMAKVRKALFSMLEARGVRWPDTAVLDLYAGSGSLAFDTGTIAFNGSAVLVEQGSPLAMLYTQVKSPFASDYQSGDNRISRSGSQPSVFANAEFDIGGALGGTALSAIAGGTI